MFAAFSIGGTGPLSEVRGGKEEAEMEARPRRSGWVSLVGILFLLAGAFDVIWGLLALGVSLGGSDRVVLGDLSQGGLEGLGVVGLIVGLVQVFAGAGILNRVPSARVLGLALAVIVVLLNFAYHQVLDGWAFTGLILNLAIILILTLRRDEFA
jgi:hypothetical protein